MTSHVKGHRFEVELPEGLPVQGVVLSDPVKSADRQHRAAEYIAMAPAVVLDQVRAKLKPLIGT